MLRIAAIVIALVCLLIGAMSAGIPEARDPVGAAIMYSYGGILIALVLLSLAVPAALKPLRWFLIVTILLALIAYALPQSFWHALGLGRASA